MRKVSLAQHGCRILDASIGHFNSPHLPVYAFFADIDLTICPKSNNLIQREFNISQQSTPKSTLPTREGNLSKLNIWEVNTYYAREVSSKLALPMRGPQVLTFGSPHKSAPWGV